MPRIRMGRRPGLLAFPRKSIKRVVYFQPAVKKALEAAALRSGHSMQDVLHLVCLTSVRVQDVTARAFERYGSEMGTT